MKPFLCLIVSSVYEEVAAQGRRHHDDEDHPGFSGDFAALASGAWRR